MTKRRKLTKEQRQIVYDKCKGHCAYCGCALDYKDMQVDHVVPIRKNGEDTIGNMLPACRSCNHYKSTLTVEQFRQMVEKMPETLMRDSVTYKNAVRFGLVKPTPHKVMFFFEGLRDKVVYKTKYPVTIFDVAKYILEKCGEMSSQKLQKLCYYAQVWTLAWDGQELFPEDFMAWSSGAVCEELYNSLRRIYPDKFSFNSNDIGGDSAHLSEWQKNNIDIILEHYAKKDNFWLTQLSMMEAPWRDARNGTPPGYTCHNIIPKESMERYYTKLYMENDT